MEYDEEVHGGGSTERAIYSPRPNGGYTYNWTGDNSAVVTLNIDGGGSKTLNLDFTNAEGGASGSGTGPNFSWISETGSVRDGEQRHLRRTTASQSAVEGAVRVIGAPPVAAVEEERAPPSRGLNQATEKDPEAAERSRATEPPFGRKTR